MAIRQRTARHAKGNRVGETPKLTGVAGDHTRNVKVKAILYPTSILTSILKPTLGSPDLMDTHYVHGDLCCSSLDLTLLEACIDPSSTSTHLIAT